MPIYFVISLRNKQIGTSARERFFGKLREININDLTRGDPLSNGVIDLSSNKYQLSESDFDLLVGEKAGIRRLRRDALIKKCLHRLC